MPLPQDSLPQENNVGVRYNSNPSEDLMPAKRHKGAGKKYNKTIKLKFRDQSKAMILSVSHNISLGLIILISI
jgi:hypothetical protein